MWVGTEPGTEPEAATETETGAGDTTDCTGTGAETIEGTDTRAIFEVGIAGGGRWMVEMMS